MSRKGPVKMMLNHAEIKYTEVDVEGKGDDEIFPTVVVNGKR
jgi:hypothetical protein